MVLGNRSVLLDNIPTELSPSEELSIIAGALVVAIIFGLISCADPGVDQSASIPNGGRSESMDIFMSAGTVGMALG